MNYFLIPGNPPAVQFYQLWGEEIIQHSTHAKFMVSQYPLLDQMSDSSKAMDLVFLEHLRQFRIFSEEVRSPVTIIGHSLGAHFALKMLEEQGESIDHIVLIHPFLKKPDLKGLLILKAAGAIHTYSRLQSGILKNRKYLEFFSEDLLSVTDDEILKSFHLARHESQTIAKNLETIEINPQDQKKICVFFTKNDIWCGEKTVKELRNLVKVIECEEPHGFVIDGKHRKSLYQKILDRHHS
jgi:thioesterase domain-containing protein